MNHLLEEYEVETIEELYEAMVLSEKLGMPFAHEIYCDLVLNNLEESFINWYATSENEMPINQLLEILNNNEETE
jgi:hypothetical protein